VFVVALLAVVAAGGFFGAKGLLDLFSTLEPQVATITVIISLVALLCAAIIAGGFKWMGRWKKQVQTRAQKAPLYEQLVLLWGKKLTLGLKAAESSIEEDLHKLEWRLTLHGSVNVLKAYQTLQHHASTLGLRSPEVASSVAKLLLTMRRELGVSSLSLTEQDLTTVMQGGEAEEPLASPAHMGRHPVSVGQGI
jgi:hypothetical protein